MPLFLFWYIFRDLLKLLLLTTAVLVTVIAFGAAIRPLSEGLIGPLRILEFILLAMPPMLQFALPFAAAFSATIVYHRLGQDNELSACAAVGVPYTHLLLPAATLGVFLTIGLSLLTNYVSPKFWEAMNRTAHLDAPEFFVRSVQHSEPISAGDLLIRARAVEQITPPPESNAYASLRVYGLVVMVLNRGSVEAIGTAPQGVFNLTRVGENTIVNSILDQLVVINQDNDDLLRTRESQLEPWVIPTSFKDSPKFMDINKLHAIVKAPQNFWRVAQKIDAFRIWLAKRRFFRYINEQLHATGRAVLTGTPGNDGSPSRVRIEIYAKSIFVRNTDEWLIYAGKNKQNNNTANPSIRIIRFIDGRPDVEWNCPSATIRPVLNSMLVEPTVTINLVKPTVTILASSVKTKRQKASFPRLHATQPIAAPIRNLPVADLVKLARQFGDDKIVQPMSQSIQREIQKVWRNILSRIHERTAMSVSCLIMMLLGATLAIRLRTSLPLTVYFWSFIPAIGGLILISTGADIVRMIDASDLLGLLVTWSGNLTMTIFTLIILRQVMRT